MPAPTLPPRTPDPRPQLAFVVNNLTPYRIQCLLRVKNELPQFRIKTYVTWNLKRNLWVYGSNNMPELDVVAFPDAVAESQIGTPDFYLGEWRTGGKIIEHLKADPPVAIVVAGYRYPAMGRVIRWCTRTKTPWLMWGDSNVHSDTIKGFQRWIKKKILGWIIRHVGALLICGDNGVRYYQNYGARRDEIFYFPVEPDYHLIDHPDRALHAQIASQYGLVPGRRRLLVCSRLVPVKAVDQAIDAFAAVAYKLPNLDLVIVGDGPLREELKDRVPSPLRSRVIFAGFFDAQEKVNAFYHQCDVLLHPAVWEPWGVVILEAAAAGLAIITTNVVGTQPEVAINGRNAVIIRPNDRRGLADAIVNIMRDDVIDKYKAQSKVLSDEFRVRCDLVKGLAGALTRVGVMPQAPVSQQAPTTQTVAG